VDAEGLAEIERAIALWERPEKQTDSRRTPDAAPRYLEQLAGLYFELAIACHERSKPRDETLRSLRLAGEYSVRDYEARREPAPNSARNLYELIQRKLALVVCFCAPEWRKRLVKQPSWSYDAPTGNKNAFPYFRAYLRQALHFVEHGTVRDADQERLLAELDGEKGPKKEQEGEEVLAGLVALAAIDRKDESALHGALRALVLLHERRAKKGVYRNMLEGRIFMNGMFLAQIARERGLSVDLSSSYLPLELLA